jgi:hypothetical protein
MAENVNLNKVVFSKKSYKKTIDTSFKELGVQTIQEQIQSQPSVQEFFDLYNELFYNINELGPTNSHEFLIKTSSEYIGFEDENELIKLLQEEIASLREQLLASQKQLVDLTNLIPEAPEIEIPELEIPEEPEPPQVETPTPVTPPTPPPPTNKQRVITDFKKYPKSNKNKRASRLNLSKDFIKKIKKNNNL